MSVNSDNTYKRINNTYDDLFFSFLNSNTRAMLICEIFSLLLLLVFLLEAQFHKKVESSSSLSSINGNFDESKQNLSLINTTKHVRFFPLRIYKT